MFVEFDATVVTHRMLPIADTLNASTMVANAEATVAGAASGQRTGFVTVTAVAVCVTTAGPTSAHPTRAVPDPPPEVEVRLNVTAPRACAASRPSTEPEAVALAVMDTSPPVIGSTQISTGSRSEVWEDWPVAPVAVAGRVWRQMG
jgi:hypothetical protein